MLIHLKCQFKLERLVTISFYSYAIFVIFILNSIFLYECYMKKLKKIHMSDVQEPRLVPFNLPAAYATGGDTPHGR
jgi:hypothetical protein